MADIPKMPSRIRQAVGMMKWHFFRAQGRPFPLIVNISVTGQCNFRCQFCYIDHTQKKGAMPRPLFERIVNELGRLGTIYLYLSGGEPLLIPDIAEWIQLAKKYIPFVHMVSNGYLLDGNRATQLEQSGLDMISLSLDGDQPTHDAFRRKPGSFDRVIAAIGHLRAQAPSIRPVISSMVAPWNAHALESLAQTCRDIKVDQRLTATAFYPQLQAEHLGSQLWNNDNNRAIETIAHHLRQRQRWWQYDPFLDMIPAYYRAQLEQRHFEHPVFDDVCPIPEYYVNILENGEVFPCPGVTSSLYGETSQEKATFSCQSTPLRTIFEGPEYRSMRQQLRPCQDCRQYLASCYLRPRLVFPLKNFWRYRLLPHWRYLFSARALPRSSE
jgi:MoaA/NifB/PqqE/SkfB family radical SAM enzyme